MNNRYFRLFEECYLIEGKKGSAIYNLLTGDIFPIERKEAELLSALENNQSLDPSVLNSLGDGNKADNLLKLLEEKQLGSYYCRPVHVEKVTKEANWADKLFFRMPPQLHRAFIEIETKCLNNCKYCGSDSVIRRLSCMGCNKWDTASGIMPIYKVFQVLEQLKELDCKKLYFTGGDIFLDWGRTKEILSKAARLGFKDISVIWGGHSLPSKIIEFLATLNVTILIQKYIGPGTNSVIESNPFYEGLVTNHTGLRYAFLLVSEYRNNKLVEQSVPQLSKILKPEYILIDFILDEQEPLAHKYMLEVNRIPRTSVDDFAIRRKYHPCLGGTLSITADGSVLPCPGLREYKLGTSSEILNIFERGDTDKYWRLTKDKVDGCSQCQYRYACNDCRYLEQRLCSNLFGMGSCESALELAATEGAS